LPSRDISDLVVAIAHEQQQVVADQRHVLLHAVDGLLVLRHRLHRDLQEAHRGAVLEIHDQRRVDRVIDLGLGRGLLGGVRRRDRLDAVIMPSAPSLKSGMGCSEALTNPPATTAPSVSANMPAPLINVPTRPPDFLGGALLAASGASAMMSIPRTG
jgi:hypothetical protein